MAQFTGKTFKIERVSPRKGEFYLVRQRGVSVLKRAEHNFKRDTRRTFIEVAVAAA